MTAAPLTKRQLTNKRLNSITCKLKAMRIWSRGQLIWTKIVLKARAGKTVSFHCKLTARRDLIGVVKGVGRQYQMADGINKLTPIKLKGAR